MKSALKSATRVVMSKKAFIGEHKELIKTLKSGSKKKLQKEIREQSEELRHIK